MLRGGKFLSILYLEIHRAILIGYNCPVCNTKVEEAHTCVFVCDKCERCFTSKAMLREHLKIHIKIEIVCDSVSLLSDHENLKMQLSTLNYK